MFNSELIKNKIAAILLLVIGFLTMLIDNDGTAFLLIALVAIPLFFAKENWIS